MIQSLGLVLGLVGGLSGIIWGLLALLFGGYEQFKLENALIANVFHTAQDSQDDQDSDSDDDNDVAKKVLIRKVSRQGSYSYGYLEYVVTRILSLFCWCCRRSTACSCLLRRLLRLERYREAVEKLTDEMDVVNFLAATRIGTFLATQKLESHQRDLV